MDQRDKQLLDFETRHPERGMTKTAAIHTELGIDAVRYEMRLEHIMRDPEALKIAAVTVHRWERLRDDRAARRGARVFR